jgi:hypothetical protein
VLRNDVSARSKPQVKRITKENLCTRSTHVIRGHAFNRAVGTDRHEGGGLDLTSRKGHRPSTREAVFS